MDAHILKRAADLRRGEHVSPIIAKGDEDEGGDTAAPERCLVFRFGGPFPDRTGRVQEYVDEQFYEAPAMEECPESGADWRLPAVLEPDLIDGFDRAREVYLRGATRLEEAKKHFPLDGAMEDCLSVRLSACVSARWM